MGSRHRRRTTWAVWMGVWLVTWLAVGAPCRAADSLDAGFRNPPAGAKPHTWWHWVSGNASKEGVTADLEAMKRIGVGGAQMFFVDQVPNSKDRGPVRSVTSGRSGVEYEPRFGSCPHLAL